MASQEKVSSASQPDTQNADVLTLTQSQEVSSQQALTIWGRLCPIRTSLKGLEMTKDAYTMGRSESCDICITTNEMQSKWLNVISKIHFCIYRERISNTNEIVVYLEDKSQNGTFVDKIKVGRGNRVIIESNSEIAVAKGNFSVYLFISTIMPEANELPPQLKQKYALGRKLGAGACGEVRMIFTKDGSKKFAIKTIKKNDFGTNGNIFNNPEKIWNEVEILKKLKHSCIIQMEEICDTPTAVYIVLELMQGGELFDRIRSKGKLSESCAKLIFYQVVLAVHYLHKEGITHRDLKPENILLKSDTDKTLVKVSDFGMSKLVDAKSRMTTFCGTPMYVAPEILATHGRSPYTSQVDVWSLGVILYACLTGMVPFNVHRKDAPLEEQIIHGLYGFPQSHFGHISQDAIQLIQRMMTVNPKKRITMPQILLHSWLRDPRMREEANKLMTGIEHVENDENVPPSNIFKNRREIDLLPEFAKRARLQA